MWDWRGMQHTLHHVRSLIEKYTKLFGWENLREVVIWILRYRFEDYIKSLRAKFGCFDSMNFDHWPALVNTVMNVRALKFRIFIDEGWVRERISIHILHRFP
jgi:hypothetical protein